MQTFKLKAGYSIFYKTLRRAFLELLVLAILAVYFWSDWSEAWPQWLKVSILVGLAIFILGGLAYYPKAKLFADTFSVCLMEKALGISARGKMVSIPYSDLPIPKVKKRNGTVVSISFRARFGQSIVLKELENMQELYEGICAGIERTSHGQAIP